MGRITEARDDAWDILDAVIAEVEAIVSDPEIAAAMSGKKSGMTVIGLARLMLSKHRDNVARLIAIDDGVPVEEQSGKLSAAMIPLKLMRILNDPTIHELFFGSAATKKSADGSSAASMRGDG